MHCEGGWVWKDGCVRHPEALRTTDAGTFECSIYEKPDNLRKHCSIEMVVNAADEDNDSISMATICSLTHTQIQEHN